MGKKTPEIRMESYGIYEPFDKAGKELPKIRDFTTRIPVGLGVEFGYILHIRKARGETLRFVMEHPPFCDAEGEVAPPFTGEEFINANDYRFFLGDTFWLPLEDKAGLWRLMTYLGDEMVAEKSFTAHLPDPSV